MESAPNNLEPFSADWFACLTPDELIELIVVSTIMLTHQGFDAMAQRDLCAAAHDAIAKNMQVHTLQ